MKRLFIILFVLLPILVFSQGSQTASWMPDSTLSRAINLPINTYPVGIVLPAAFTDSLKFQITYNGTDYPYLHDARIDSTNVYKISVDNTLSILVPLDPAVFFFVRRFKIILSAGVTDPDTTCTILYESKD